MVTPLYGHADEGKRTKFIAQATSSTAMIANLFTGVADDG
jgi:hypothetical protein